MISLNLVPDSEKKEVHILYFYLGMKNIIFILLVGVLFSATSLLFGKIVMLNYFEESLTHNTVLASPVSAKLKQINTLQTQLVQVKKIQGKFIPWSNFLYTFDRLINEGVTLDRLQAGRDGKLNLSGTAHERKDLQALELALKHSGYFKDFKIPYEVFFDKKDIHFTLTLEFDLNAMTK